MATMMTAKITSPTCIIFEVSAVIAFIKAARAVNMPVKELNRLLAVIAPVAKCDGLVICVNDTPVSTLREPLSFVDIAGFLNRYAPKRSLHTDPS